LSGFLTTIVNIYTARNRTWSIIAIITAAVAGSCSILMLALFLIYDVWLLTKVKEDYKEKLKEIERMQNNNSEGYS